MAVNGEPQRLPRPLPAEPIELRQRMRAGLDRDSRSAERWLGRNGPLAEYLLGCWLPELLPRDRARFGGVIDRYRRELWLWATGNRTWAQCVAGLAGRLKRRGLL